MHIPFSVENVAFYAAFTQMHTPLRLSPVNVEPVHGEQVPSAFSYYLLEHGAQIFQVVFDESNLVN